MATLENAQTMGQTVKEIYIMVSEEKPYYE